MNPTTDHGVNAQPGNVIADEEVMIHPKKLMDASDPNMVDWLGRPTTQRHRGGTLTSIFILGVVICGYFAFGGVFFNLVLYLRRVWEQGSATAANNATNLVGTIYFTCLLGAFLGDAYLGRIHTIVVFLVVFIVGSAMASLMVTFREHEKEASERFLMMGLYITSVGCGCYQPVIVSLGGDQFTLPTQKARFFSWVFVASNIGVMLALTLLTYIENMGRWALGYWISTASVGISIAFFLIGVPCMRQTKLGGNPLLCIVQVLVAAISKIHKPLDDKSNLFDVSEKKSSTSPSMRLDHTDRMRWLDKAALMPDMSTMKDDEPTSWQLCTVTQVEEVKCVLSILPVILVGALYNVANAQLVSLFVVQGDTMNNDLHGFKVPPGSMRLFTNIAGILFPPFYEYLVVPRIRSRTGHAKGLTSLQKMGCGIVVGTIGMAVAAVVEMERLRSFPSKISILWLIPQFVIIGISNALFVVSQMDFFYSEISQSMRSLGSSLFLVCMGLGSYVSSLLVTIANSISSIHGALWIPRNISNGHVDYFYWLLTGILLLDFLILLVYSASYRSFEPTTQKLNLVPPRESVSE